MTERARTVSQFSMICAIEAGRLEAQTLLMLESLKRFGGALKDAPVVAFQGRSGEKISRAAREALSRLGVDYVFRPELNHAPWFNYTNKIAAVRYAQDSFDTPWRIWLDSDILFLDEPSFAKGAGLAETDFQARFEYLAPALSDTDDRFADYWAQVCDLCGVSFGEIGFCDLDLPHKRMKPYFNSGFFLWRAETGFAETYARNFYRLLGARIAPRGIGPWFADQVSLTPTVAALDLRWRMLSPEDHLMLFQNTLESPEFLDRIQGARLVHYSKSRNAPYRDVFDPLVLARRPELEDLLREYDGFAGQDSAGTITRVRKYARRLRQELYVRACKGV